MNKNQNSYLEIVEKSFALHSSTRHGEKNKKEGRLIVLQFLVDHPETIWWWAWEFVGKHNSKNEYLSHRAPARVSDLAIHEPELVEHRRIGKFKVYRLRRENMQAVMDRLNDK